MNLADIWKDMPRKPRLIPLAPYLLLAAVVLFLLEVVAAAHGAAVLAPRRPAAAAPREMPARLPEKSAAARKAEHKHPATKKIPAQPPLPPAADAAGAESMTDVLGQAQRRHRQRTRRNS